MRYDESRFRTIMTDPAGWPCEVEDLSDGSILEGPTWGVSDPAECDEIVRAEAFDSVCEALDGSSIEPDGVTYDGYPSWVMYWGIV